MDIKDLTHAMHEFVRQKGWYDPASPRPQTAKNIAISLNIEAAEVLELFQWAEKTPDTVSLEGELADVMLYLLQLAGVSGIDLESAVLEKLNINYNRQWDQQPQENKVSSHDNEN